MPDTRKTFAVGKPIPGFKAGQGRSNQVKQTALKAGDYDWNIHATIESFDFVGNGAGRQSKVKAFHVSLYSDGTRWGGFYWSYSNGSYGGGKYKGESKSQFGDASALGKILGTANKVAQGLKGTFGNPPTNIAAASW